MRLKWVTLKIDLINAEFYKQTYWDKATSLAKDVDQFDIPFIALSLELNAPLWTGDKKLIKGLNNKGVDWILNTKIIKDIRNRH